MYGCSPFVAFVVLITRLVVSMSGGGNGGGGGGGGNVGSPSSMRRSTSADGKHNDVRGVRLCRYIRVFHKTIRCCLFDR